ncbi:anaerobic ribonucleoside-triphosphate reductase [Flammeovirga yaeyamensis]|uniref:Anaerobic ribonucleoside-triphosphate reductase n=1 Tax=Flammeovirga yaeyamensis TaxID=367791 RepID=A0AAX1N656_9BACT|nr:anaerobic ribonucleoside-triphosphate reductase [Flammeovirga yaeyamensis]MBB3697503.1 ribonucleoside-triphosphate reductase [Flammeovirga yaeyamensis]NMF36197.1 anaerobic ribonucleoside-triphosphate reductase [Flammeovirga yaeyamensis]QWG02929.1 anaerobic ribonucleoside-triphosphate reductase [Flammeovirga yaeyamensis]
MVITQDSKLLKFANEAINLTNVENENANMPEGVFTAKLTRMSGEISKEYTKAYLLPEKHLKMHEEGWIYIHDFSSYAVGMQNCMFIDVGEILSKPIHTTNGTMRPPKSIRSALQVTAVVLQCQSNAQFGGIAINAFDFHMAKFIKLSFYKHMETAIKFNVPDPDTFAWDQVKEETKQACEAFLHNLNHLESRAGNQLPFVSINYGCDTSREGRLFIECMLNATMDGIGEKRTTPIFPIQIWQYRKEEGKILNEDLFQLANECSIKRVYPNYVNTHQEVYDILDKNGKIVPDLIPATMGCRTRLGKNLHGYNGKSGRGNLSPVTMNLPKYAMETDSWEEFCTLVKEMAFIGIDMMEARLRWQRKQLMGAAPFMYKNKIWKHDQPYNEKAKIGDILYSGTLALGFIGIAEALLILEGKHHGESEESQEKALNLIKDLHNFCDKESRRRRLNISLYATPAESLCHTFAKKLQEQYGHVQGVFDKEFITNSFHVPVWHNINYVDKIAIEAPYHKYCSGGSITYVELRSEINKTPHLYKNLIEGAMEEGVYYFATNIQRDRCLNCDHEGLFDDLKCDKCQSKDIITLRRVTGYITGAYHKVFNNGKKDEVRNRVKHN